MKKCEECEENEAEYGDRCEVCEIHAWESAQEAMTGYLYRENPYLETMRKAQRLK